MERRKPPSPHLPRRAAASAPGRRGARAGGGRAVEGRGRSLHAALSLHSFSTRQIHYYSTGSRPPSSFFKSGGEGKGNRKGAPLWSGKEGEPPHLEREKEERMEGGSRQTRGQRLWCERLEDTSFPSHPSRLGSPKSELTQLVPSAPPPPPAPPSSPLGGMLCIYVLQTLRGAPQRPTAQGSAEHPGGAGGAVTQTSPGLEDRQLRAVRVGVGRWMESGEKMLLKEQRRASFAQRPFRFFKKTFGFLA